MYSVKMDGQKAVVSRELELPFVEHLGSHKLKGSFSINCDLGVPAKSPEAQKIYVVFLKKFKPLLKTAAEKRSKEYISFWKTSDQEMRGLLQDIKKSNAKANEIYSEMEKRWQAFSTEEAIRLGEKCLSEAIKETGQQALTKARKKVALSDADNKSARVGFLKGLRDFVSTAVAAVALTTLSGPAAVLAAIAAFAAGTAALWSMYKNASDIAKRQATDGKSNAEDLHKGLLDILKGFDRFAPAVEQARRHKGETTRKLIELHAAAEESRKQLTQGAKDAKAAHEDKAARIYAQNAKEMDAQAKEINALALRLKQLGDLEDKIKAARAAVEAAEAAAKAERTTWGEIEGEISTLRKDGTDLLGAAKSLAAEMSKAVKEIV